MNRNEAAKRYGDYFYSTSYRHQNATIYYGGMMS